MNNRQIAVAAGPKGGTFYRLARAAAEHRPANEMAILRPIATSGTAENLSLIEAGKVDLGFANMGAVYEAWSALPASSEGEALGSNLFALAPVYAVPFQLVVLSSSGVTRFSQLDRKRVGVAMGPSKGPAETLFRSLAKDLKIAPDVIVDTPSELVDLLAINALDAMWIGTEFPAGAIENLASRSKIEFVGLDRSEIDLIRHRFGHMSSYTVPRLTYPGQSQPVTTVAMWSFAVANGNLREETVYRLMPAILGAYGSAGSGAFSSTELIRSAFEANTFLPFHPGALRFLEENGAKRREPARRALNTQSKYAGNEP